MAGPTMTSNRPYLIRALHGWIGDNGCTPYLLVDADAEGVDVPRGSVEEGRIVLNIGMSAVQQLELGDDYIAFSARFAGKPTEVFVPVDAVLAIYARENGQGMVFPPIEAEARDDELDEHGSVDPSGSDAPEPPKPPKGPRSAGGPPKLKVVK